MAARGDNHAAANCWRLKFYIVGENIFGASWRRIGMANIVDDRDLGVLRQLPAVKK